MTKQAQSSITTARQDLEASINRLAKRLGGKRLKECLENLPAADDEEQWFSIDAHASWIDGLLRHYYDKYYDRALIRLDRPVAFRGSAADVLEWFAASDL